VSSESDLHEPDGRATGGFVAVAGLCTGLVVVLRWAISRSGWVRSTDAATLRWMAGHRSAALSSVFRTITAFGDVTVVIPLVLLGAALLAWRRRGDLAVVLLASSAGTWVLVNSMKLAVQRPRPPEAVRLVAASGWSFPSGHAGQAAGAYFALAVLFAMAVGRTRWSAVVVVVGAAVALLIGASRIYLGVHWLSDVVAGWAVAVAWLAVLLAVLSLRRRGANRALF